MQVQSGPARFERSTTIEPSEDQTATAEFDSTLIETDAENSLPPAVMRSAAQLENIRQMRDWLRQTLSELDPTDIDLMDFMTTVTELALYATTNGEPRATHFVASVLPDDGIVAVELKTNSATFRDRDEMKSVAALPSPADQSDQSGNGILIALWKFPNLSYQSKEKSSDGFEHYWLRRAIRPAPVTRSAEDLRSERRIPRDTMRLGQERRSRDILED